MIRDRYRIGTLDGWVELLRLNAAKAYYEYQLSFDDETPIRPQAFGIELTPDRFIREVAPARTFVTCAQAAKIRASGRFPRDKPRSVGHRRRRSDRQSVSIRK